MRLVLCCNHSYPHIGGSERVLKQISDSLSKPPFNHDIYILSGSIKTPAVYEGVHYLPLAPTYGAFYEQLRNLKPDHTFVYGDYFRYCRDFVTNANNLPGTKSIALVGANYFLTHLGLFDLLKRNNIVPITHSKVYRDYTACLGRSLDPKVIPYGIDLTEFDENKGVIRPGANDKKMVLCVSNFFPGKGQEHLVRILKNLFNKRQDWYIVFVSATINFPIGKYLSIRCRMALDQSQIEWYMLEDLPRTDVISAFKSCDLLTMPSQQEVGPLVLLEAQAAGNPWISLPVGISRELKGGMLVPAHSKDTMGRFNYSPSVDYTFMQTLDSLLSNEAECKRLGKTGRQQVEERYLWKDIVPQYDQAFSNA